MKIGVTGHQSIPEAATRYIRNCIQESLKQHASEALVCISSLAVGADQLVAEMVLNQGGDLHVVVPSEGYSLTFETLEDRQRFEQLKERAKKVEVLRFSEPSNQAFLAAGRAIVDRCDRLIAIWDGERARGIGGTADVVAYAKDVGRETRICWPHGVMR
jgi:hypothetical protein